MRVPYDKRSLQRSLKLGVLSILGGYLGGCSGGEGFSNAPQQPPRIAAVNVIATASLVKCPQIDGYSVSPAVHVAGEDVVLEVNVTATHGGTPAYSWTAQSGTFSSPSASTTHYRCGARSNASVTITIVYLDCTESIDIPIDCT